MKQWYREDLAFIHDVGFGDYALKSAPGILKILERNNIQQGLVLDLGCGSGLWVAELVRAGYRVLGIDISESMIAIARARVPVAEFRVESFLKTDIPPCDAVTSIGECLNYLFDSDNDNQMLCQLFHRVYNAIAPAGVFIFDIAEPGQVTHGCTAKGFTEGEDWIVLVEKEENQETQTLTRRIITFRKIGEHYRRDDEFHCQRLYKPTDIVKQLRQVGFQVQTLNSYGQFHLPPAHTAFIARKPE